MTERAGSRAIVGCVVIGRNEGERLRRCLESLAGRSQRLVYVDSGSTDGSVALARSLGADVVEIDLSTPFTAARARNAGYRRLRELEPALDFVQFVDGDCAVAAGWLETARDFLIENPNVAVVCGRRRELRPRASVYNELCDIEWDTPVGEARACGGDAMMRASAFDAVNGFNPTLIAGEEPELCVRLRARGFSIQRLAHEMTLHDAAIERFPQWWRRSVRAGYAYAEGASLHGAPPERHYVPQLRRALFWGGCVPAATAFGFVPTLGLSSFLPLAYGVSAWRSYRATRARGRGPKSAAAYAAFCTIGKFAELQGVLRFYRLRVLGRKSRLIEYKG
jgi:GT2 family glycosyltransferase